MYVYIHLYIYLCLHMHICINKIDNSAILCRNFTFKAHCTWSLVLCSTMQFINIKLAWGRDTWEKDVLDLKYTPQFQEIFLALYSGHLCHSGDDIWCQGFNLEHQPSQPDARQVGVLPPILSQYTRPIIYQLKLNKVSSLHNRQPLLKSLVNNI